MIIARITSQDTKNSSATSSVTATYPAVPAVGNLMIAVVSSNVTTGSNTITGWTVYGDGLFNSSTSSITILFRVVVDGDSATVTANATSATSMNLHIYEYKNTKTSAPNDINITSSAGSATSTAIPTFSTKHKNDVIIFGMAFGGAVSSPTISAGGYSINQSDSTLISGEQIVTKDTQYTGTVSWTTAQVSGVIAAAFKSFDNNYYNKSLRPHALSPGLAR